MRRGFGFHDRHSPFRFNPATLFQGGGVQGAWYDPSDITTLFQDSAGTTPVTAVGQVVGLMLDKSQGLALGPELLGTGVVGLVGTATAATYSTTTGAGSVTRVDASNQSFVSITVAANSVLRIRLTATNGDVRIREASPAGSAFAIVTSGQSIDQIISTASGLIYFTAHVAGTSSFVLTSLKIVAGNHAFQTSSGSCPLWQQSSGLSYLAFDGSNDSMLTGAINFTGTNKMTVWAGVTKSSDAAQGVVAELSADIASNNGAFLLSAPNSAAANYNWSSKGTTQVDNTVTTYAAPNTAVLTGQADIAGPSNIIRVNGAQAGSVATTQGTGNYGNYPLYIGRRNNASLPFNGRLYGLIVLGAAASDWQVYVTEQWMAGKTGLQF